MGEIAEIFVGFIGVSIMFDVLFNEGATLIAIFGRKKN